MAATPSTERASTTARPPCRRGLFAAPVIAMLVTACGGDREREPAGDAGGGVDGAAIGDAALLACGEADEIVTLRFGADDLTGCTVFRGSIHVPDATDPNQLAPLGNLVRIDGRLTLFRNHALSDLRGLERLERVGGLFSIRLDDSDGRFTTLDGLDSLREVGELEITGNPWLASLAGLASLEVVHGDLHITGNGSLPRSEIDALLARVRVEGMVDLGSGM